ncbi:MAG: hypothetical protein LC646_07295 [Xanthomonadaceae bacterium]|nr:hypothetical protein [Xanthomonadaceae bacterium]
MLIPRSFTLSALIGLYAGMALLVFALVLSGLMVLGLNRILEDSLQDKANMLARQIATVSLDAVLMHDYGVLERYTADLAGSDGLVYLRIRREDGVVLAEAGKLEPGAPVLLLEKPVLLANRPVGDVTVAYERRHIDRTITRFTLISVAGVAVLATLLFFSLKGILRRRLIKPIERLAHDMNPLLDTIPEAQPLEGAPSEVLELRHTFEQLRGEVRHHIEEIEQANRVARAATQRLCQGQRLASIGQMAAGLAHSLNTPLGNIMGYAQQAQRKARDEDMRARIEVIQRQAGVCSEIVCNLLNAARTPQIHVQAFDLAELARATVKLLSPVVRDHGVELHLEEGPVALAVLGDVGGVEQIMFNLINNAVQADAGTICVRVQAEAGRGVLQVEDDGSGIPAEVQPRIFEALFTTKAAGSGTGLGLHLCQTLAAGMQSSIRLVESRPGLTIFELALPRAG